MAEGEQLPQNLNADNQQQQQNLNDAFLDDEVDGPNILAANNNLQGRVNTTQIKIPPFWKADPELWFLQIEAQFTSAGIRTDLSKYNQIVGKLDTDTLTAVSDIVKNPPANDKYQTIKNRLTNQFAETDRQKLKTLFRDLSLNDEKPSDLFRKMKDKSCNKVGDDLLQELWTTRLPQQIQSILSCSNEQLAQQVIMADKIHETLDLSTIQTLSQSNPTQSDFTTQICQLEDKIESLTREFNRSRSHNSSAKRYRSSSRSTHRTKRNENHCWYHQIHGDKAYKCDPHMKPPCSYKKDKQSKN